LEGPVEMCASVNIKGKNDYLKRSNLKISHVKIVISKWSSRKQEVKKPGDEKHLRFAKQKFHTGRNGIIKPILEE
jgi:hypothetical protein